MAKGQRRKNLTSSNNRSRERPNVSTSRAGGPKVADPARSNQGAPALMRVFRSARQLPRWAVAAIATIVVVAGIAVGYLAFGRSVGASGAGPMIGYAVPDEGHTHVAEGSFVQYQHNPPSSGSHYPAPTNWGVYNTPVPPGLFVHNLEHGGITVLYDCPSGCPAIVSQLDDAFKNFPVEKFGEVKLVVSPYHPLPEGAKVTALAWDVEYDFTQGFDENQLLAFYQQHVDHGREDVP